MTGFAISAREFDYGTLNVELRSVNHRYLEVQIRLPDELRVIEANLREVIASRVNRGKVDCRVAYMPKASADTDVALNPDVLQQLLRYNAEIKRLIPEVRPLSVANVLDYPGIVSQQALSVEQIAADAATILDEALQDLERTRAREGEKLKGFLVDRIERMQALAQEIAPKMPELVAAFQERLTTRIKEALGNCDDDRLRQEVVLFASKVDVDEELSRLQAHLVEVRSVLDKGGQVGKRLDFLMQELNREANTLSSKSISPSVSKSSVELKVLIEQMREQVQNIE